MEKCGYQWPTYKMYELAWWVIDWNKEIPSDQWGMSLDSNPLWVEHGVETNSISSDLS